MLNTEAIILAGGLGTRLRSAVPDLPKCMAPVGGQPFLHYVIEHLQNEGIEKFIFSLGYKYELVVDWLEKEHSALSFQCSVEDSPLGTGGAVQQACTFSTTNDIIVANGDTLFEVDIRGMKEFYLEKKADCVLSLKPMRNFNRYGVVELDNKGQVNSFREKQQYEEGLINGGLYLINKNNFLSKNLPAQFSLEKDYLERYHKEDRMLGYLQDKYFIDIGIPEDFERAQNELRSNKKT